MAPPLHKLHKKLRNGSRDNRRGLAVMFGDKEGKRRIVALAVALSAAAVAGLPRIAGAETVMRIGMTAADIPRTLGQPDQGFEGNRFTGLTMYDALTLWDLSSADKASVVIPGLATEWSVDSADKKKWIFKLRPGVKFHDGSPFNADAVVWNVDKVLKQDAGAVRSEPGRRHRVADADAGLGAQDRRTDGGTHHQGGG
jgi:ABC-type transport system substrate-binding protein